MSTIASPRDSSLSLVTRRAPGTGTPVLSPVGSARPSLELPRSPTASPGLSPSGATPANALSLGAPAGAGTMKRKNRAAFREYYNIQRGTSPAMVPVAEGERSEVPHGEMDSRDFDAGGFVKRVAEKNGLEELLRVYTKVLGEMRALDAEKKALVYDNYNKLITATETIRKMRTNMDPLNPMASMLDPKMAQIHAQASAIRESLRSSIPEPDPALNAQKRMREVAADVLNVPARLKYLVNLNRIEEAEMEWELPRKLLVGWKEKGIGGEEVGRLLEEGDDIIKKAGKEETE